ncbi:MAG: hypothetical protein WBM08_04180 [Prochlorococcaceae cyanobacterium]
MATDPDTMAFICEQVNLPGELTQRKMFGTPAEHPPYPGAKPHFRVRDEIEDPARLRQLLTATAQELPLPKPKAKPRTKLS